MKTVTIYPLDDRPCQYESQHMPQVIDKCLFIFTGEGANLFADPYVAFPFDAIRRWEVKC